MGWREANAELNDRIYRIKMRGLVMRLRAEQRELEEREFRSWLMWERYMMDVRLAELRAFKEEDHPRKPAGTSGGGQFVSKSGGQGLTGGGLPDIMKEEDIEIGRSVGAKAKNYEVEYKLTNEVFHFVEGTRIQDAQVFAGYKASSPLEEETAQGLSDQIGGTPDKWQHCKGKGVIDYYGEERLAEVHWFQEETQGKHKFKIKRWLDD